VLVAASVRAAEPGSAELQTYQREAGETYFALSLTPPAVAKAQNEPHDVVILFDTSASQTGMYRDTALAAVEACLAKLAPHDRVQLLAVDLEARPLTTEFLPANSAELRTALAALRAEPPLGSTDMEQVLRTAAARFEAARPGGRTLLYLGDGVSAANLLGTESFRGLVEVLTKARVPVSSYAIGPQCDARLLAALANQTGGNLYVAEPLALASEAENISEVRASEENVRRGAEVGTMMADWTRADVLWPTHVAWPEQLGDVYPKTVPPLRTDRDTIVVGAAAAPLESPVEVRLTAEVSEKPAELRWTATPQSMGDSYAFLAQVVEMARGDGGITLPTVGSQGLAETGRLIEASVDGLTDLAERAIATGDLQGATVAAQAVLERDPGNLKAQTVERLVERQRAQAQPVAQREAPPAEATEQTAAKETAAEEITAQESADDDSGDLNLVRTAQLPPPEPSAPPVAVPAPGSLTDRFAEEGGLLDEV
jgi:hypothetical protein